MTSPNENERTTAMVSAVRRLLKPLVRLLIAHNITLPSLTELLKEVYVEVAEKRFPIPGKRQTDSRIHLLTGVHRKDVKKLRTERDRKPEQSARSSSLGALLVSRWTGDPRYLNDQGHPLRLPKNGEVSFTSLVEEISTNIRPRAVLDEWLRLGVVEVDPEGMVHLNTEAFVPEKGFEEKCFFLGENVRGHLEACVNNLQQEGPSEPERNVYYDGLSRESVNELRRMAEKEGMHVLQQINRRAFELQQEDKTNSEALYQMRFGLYWHQEKEEEEGE